MMTTMRRIRDTSGEAWSDAEIDRLRWSLVGWRDEGYVDEAVQGLLEAGRRWPRHPQFLLELLVIRSMRPGLDLSEALSRWPAETLDHPEVALFLGLEAAAQGQLDEARKRLEQLDGVDAKRLAPFRGQYIELLELVGLEPARAAYAEAARSSSDPLSTPEAAALISVLTELLVHADGMGGLVNLTRALMYFGKLDAPAVQHVVQTAMEQARPRLSLDGKVVHLELILATYVDGIRALPLVRELMAAEATRGSARFARVASVVAARLKDGALEREVLARFTPPAQAASPLEAAQIAEVEGRRRARKLDRPLRIFVGLFGQMREPEAVLPQSIEAVRAAFADTGHGPVELHFALSTWPRTGGRGLTLDDATGFFAQAAPLEARPLLTSRNGATGHALAARMPHLVSTLVDHSTRRSARDTTPEELAGYLPQGARVVTTPEAEVEAPVRPGLARIGRENSATMNQFKMWSRIAALGDALKAHEAEQGRPMDLCLLMRCDLARVKGSLTEAAARAASPWDASTVFYDYDPHAEFIEGAGDRYMLGARDAMASLMGGYDHYLAAVRAEPLDPLASRLTAHECVQSLIVLHGLTPFPVWALGYELHRGTPPAARVAEALAADLALGCDPELAAEIKAALDRLSARPDAATS